LLGDRPEVINLFTQFSPCKLFVTSLLIWAAFYFVFARLFICYREAHRYYEDFSVGVRYESDIYFRDGVNHYLAQFFWFINIIIFPFSIIFFDKSFRRLYDSGSFGTKFFQENIMEGAGEFYNQMAPQSVLITYRDFPWYRERYDLYFKKMG